MNKITYLAAVLTLLAGVVSCQKEEGSQPQPQPQPSGEYRQITISAGTPQSNQTDQTKTSVSGGALTWSANDKLNIVPQAGSVAEAALGIKSGVGTATGTFEGKVDASITDDTALYGWCGGNWTYNSGSFTVDMPASQTYVANGLAENAYPSIGTGSIKNGIALSNPMGVLKLSVKAAKAGDAVKSITVTSANNNLAGSFTVTPGATPAVSGGSSKTLTLNASPYVALSLTDAVNFYVVLPPKEYAANDLTVKITFSDDTYSINTLAYTVAVTAGGATAKEVSDHTGRRGTLSDQEYVLIRAKYDGTNYSYLKWATQNLAVTTSGQDKWMSTNYQIGDYFQWAASYAGYGITEEASKVPTNLVVYTAFKTTGTGGSVNSITFKEGKTFDKTYAPYYDSATSSYAKYTSAPATLALTDDVANIVLGDTWRIPTGGDAGEFKAMRAVTYWAWDATDRGSYVFKPGVGTSGAAGGKGTIGTGDDKTKALLFFPAAGYGTDTRITGVRGGGRYGSATLYSFNTDLIYYLYCSSSDVADERMGRNAGYSVRPVSD